MVTTADWTEAGISTLRSKGTAVLFGGVDAKIGISYRSLLMSRAKLKLDWVLFPLQEWKEAAEYAAESTDSRTVCALSF